MVTKKKTTNLHFFPPPGKYRNKTPKEKEPRGLLNGKKVVSKTFIITTGRYVCNMSDTQYFICNLKFRIKGRSYFSVSCVEYVGFPPGKLAVSYANVLSTREYFQIKKKKKKGQPKRKDKTKNCTIRRKCRSILLLVFSSLRAYFFQFFPHQSRTFLSGEIGHSFCVELALTTVKLKEIGLLRKTC